MARQAIVQTKPSAPARPRRTAAATVLRPAPRRTRGPAAATAASTAKRETATTAKRESRRVASTATAQATRVKGTAVGQGKVVARTAGEDVRELGATVRDQADQVRGELAGQARELLSETRDQLQAQADVQTGRLAAALLQVGTQAVALAGGRPEEAGPLAQYAEQAAGWLDACAAEIEERGLEGIAADVTDFARRRPGVFLAGAAVVGFGVGRLIRSGAVSANGAEEE
ncbi:MAG: hypothetical protein M3066_12060 [Actinomycetota bacterium]|nr:hypothetical protein [Actinomycetota bacterium]